VERIVRWAGNCLCAPDPSGLKSLRMTLGSDLSLQNPARRLC
jgi:hypothetical protein